MAKHHPRYAQLLAQLLYKAGYPGREVSRFMGLSYATTYSMIHGTSKRPSPALGIPEALGEEAVKILSAAETASRKAFAQALREAADRIETNQ